MIIIIISFFIISFGKGEHHRLMKDSFWDEQLKKRQMKSVLLSKTEQQQLEQYWEKFASDHDDVIHMEHHEMAKKSFWSSQMKSRQMKSSSRTLNESASDLNEQLKALDDGFERFERDNDPISYSSQFPELEMMMDEGNSVDDESVHTYVETNNNDEKIITDENELHRYLENLLEDPHHNAHNPHHNALQRENEEHLILRIDDDDDDDNVENVDNEEGFINETYPATKIDDYESEQKDEQQELPYDYTPSERLTTEELALYHFESNLDQNLDDQVHAPSFQPAEDIEADEEAICSTDKREKRVMFQDTDYVTVELNDSLGKVTMNETSDEVINYDNDINLEHTHDTLLLEKELNEDLLMGKEDELSRLNFIDPKKNEVVATVVSKKTVDVTKGVSVEAVSQNDLFVSAKTWTTTKDAKKSNNMKRKSLKEKIQSDIFEAVRYGDKKAVEDILTSDPTKLKALDFGGTSALHISLMLKDADIAEILVSAGSPFIKDMEGKDPLEYNKDPKIYKKIKKLHDQVQGIEPVPVLSEKENRYLSLRAASFDGDIDKIKTLLAEDPTCVDDVDDQMQTALMFACMGQKIDAAMLLINSGANYKAISISGKTPLVYITDLEANKLLYETAFWASTEGIAYAKYLQEQAEEEERQRLEAERRRQWEEEQERIRQKAIRAEEQKKEREFFTKKSTRSIIQQGSLNYKQFEVSNRLAIDAHNEWIRQQGIQMMEEERYSKKMWLILDTIEENKRIAELNRRAKLAAAAEAFAQEQARLRLLEAEEQRRRELAEAKAQALREMRAQAEGEWKVLQAELREKAWIEFRSKKYIRVAKIKRMYDDLKKF